MKIFNFLVIEQKGMTVTITSSLAGTIVEWLPVITDINLYLQTVAYCVSIIVGIVTIIYKLKRRK